MAYLPVVFWCRRCWWKETFEWWAEDVLLFDLAKPLQMTSLAKRRYAYKKHREAKPNCKQKKLFFTVQDAVRK